MDQKVVCSDQVPLDFQKELESLILLEWVVKNVSVSVSCDTSGFRSYYSVAILEREEMRGGSFY